jgi:hypothetical protein
LSTSRTSAPAARALGRVREPGVLADVDAEGRAAGFEDERPVVRREVALLVEDVVVRQVVLAVRADHHAVRDHRRRVEAPALARQGVADHDLHLRILQQLRAQFLQGRVGRCVECPAQQQVFGRVTRQRQFRSEQDMRPGGSRASRGVEDLPAVALEVADGAIQLRDRDLDVRAH